MGFVQDATNKRLTQDTLFALCAEWMPGGKQNLELAKKRKEGRTNPERLWLIKERMVYAAGAVNLYIKVTPIVMSIIYTPGERAGNRMKNAARVMNWKESAEYAGKNEDPVQSSAKHIFSSILYGWQK